MWRDTPERRGLDYDNMHTLAATFMSLFEGYYDAYGICQLTGQVSSGGKAEGKMSTKKAKVTVNLWHDHLIGKAGLGIIPINGASMVKFGAIDVDDYTTAQPVAINKRIKDGGLPLMMTRTKSGGLHLWLFMTEWTDAVLVQGKLSEMAAYLGFGHSEIFPKQARVLLERGDLGSWINMPYFNEMEGGRFGYDEGRVKPLSARDFLTMASTKLVTPEQLQAMSFEAKDLLEEAPPCLCHLVKEGFPQGTRNNGLFNLAIYCRKRWPDDWRVKLAELNDKYMSPPLTPQEVMGTIKSVEKKEYVYTCKSQPIAPYCSAAKCRTRAHGIGGNDLGMPKFGSLTKIETVPPIWFMEVEGPVVRRLELTTEELQNPLLFQKRTMADLNVMPVIAKREQWHQIVQKLLETVTIIEVPPEATPKGLLLYYLQEFCTSRVSAKTPEEMLLGKPWTDGGKTYFRLQDFFKYLERCKFTEYRMNQIAYRLQEYGAERRFFNIKGKGFSTYFVNEFKNRQTESFTTPEQATRAPFT